MGVAGRPLQNPQQRRKIPRGPHFLPRGNIFHLKTSPGFYIHKHTHKNIKCGPFHCHCVFCLLRFICLYYRQRWGRERERETLSSSGSLYKWLQQPGTWNTLVLPYWWQGPSTWSVFCISRELARKWGSQDLDRCSWKMPVLGMMA